MLNFNINFKNSYLNSLFSTISAIWFERDLTEKIKDLQAKMAVEFDTDSSKKSIDWLKKQNLSWLVYQKEIETALKYDHCWSSVKLNGEIIACIKIGFKEIYISDYDKVVEFPKNMAFIYDTYVLPKYRNKGVAKYIISQAIKFAKTEGYIKVGCHIPPWNKASINAYTKNGFKKIDYIRNFKIFGLSIKISKSPKKLLINNGGKLFYG